MERTRFGSVLVEEVEAQLAVPGRSDEARADLVRVAPRAPSAAAVTIHMMGDAASVELIAAALIQAGRLPEGGDVQEAIWHARGRFENPYLAVRCVSLLGSVSTSTCGSGTGPAAHLADDEPSEGFVAAAEVLLDELAPEHLARLQEIALATRDAIDLATRADRSAVPAPRSGCSTWGCSSPGCATPSRGPSTNGDAIQILGRSDLDEAEVAALVAALDDLDGRWDILRVAAVQGAVFAGASWAVLVCAPCGGGSSAVGSRLARWTRPAWC